MKGDLENLLSELKIHAEEHCRKLGKSREVITKFRSDRSRYAEIITAKVWKEQEELNENLQERKLKPKQLKRLLHRRLFTPQTAQFYQEQQLITKEQARQINAIIHQCGGQLTESHLNYIMVGGVLATEQVSKILKTRRQTEEELKAMFDSIWTELMHQLPIVSGDHRDVEAEVEKNDLVCASTRSRRSIPSKVQRKGILEGMGWKYP